MADGLKKLSEDYLKVQEQICALEQAAAVIKAEIESKIAVIRQLDPTVKRWQFDKAAVVWVEPTVRKSLDRALLVQNGVTAAVLDKSTVEKPVKGYAKVEVVK